MIATARSFDDARQVALALSSEALLICQNGAIIYGRHLERPWRRFAIDHERVREIVKETRSRDESATVAIDYFDRRHATNGLRLMDPDWAGPYRSASGPASLWPLAAEDLPRKSAVCIMIRGSSWDSKELEARYSVSVTSSEDGLIEVSGLHVDKGTAMRTLCEDLGIPLAAVVAFGDMPNDDHMLQTAGLGVAVENADDRLLRVADEITSSNEQDGVAEFMEMLLAEHGVGVQSPPSRVADR